MENYSGLKQKKQLISVAFFFTYNPWNTMHKYISYFCVRILPYMAERNNSNPCEIALKRFSSFFRTPDFKRQYRTLTDRTECRKSQCLQGVSAFLFFSSAKILAA